MTEQAPKPSDPRLKPPVGKAFDVWLNHGLHELFDGIAKEPVPEELLRLIEEEREGQ